MCCPLTLATLTWLFSIFLPIDSGARSPVWYPKSTIIEHTEALPAPNKSKYPSHPPFVIAPIPDLSLTTDSDPFTIDLYSVFSSDENGRLSFRATINNDNIADVDVDNDQLSVSPERTGSTRIRVFAEDSDGRQATDVFRINVRENNPPQLTLDFPLQDQTIIQGDTPLTLNLSSVFKDPDGDPLSFSVSSSEETISQPVIERNILIAPGNAPGTTEIEITAVDPFGSTNSLEFELAVVRPYPQQIVTGFEISFGSISSSSSYKLFALPGNLSADLEETIEGQAGLDWTAFAQDASGEGLIPYDRSDAFQFGAGKGIWFLSKKDVEIPNQQIPSVPLSPSGTYTLSLQEGWNIISNPFDVDLDWEEVSDWNGISQTLWAWNGSYLTTDVLESAAREGQAYYFFNAENLSALELPYPGLANPFLSKHTLSATIDAFTVTAQNEQSRISQLTIGRSEEAVPGLDPLDHVAPPRHFATIELASTSNGSVPLARDIQPFQQSPNRYQITLTSQDKLPVTLRVDHLDSFASEAITLVNELDGTTYNLRHHTEIRITPEREKTPFTLFIGSSAQVQEAVDTITPALYTLKQNFPNPLQSSTTIEFSLPDPQHAKLSIYDSMGRLVQVLLDQAFDAGLHRVEWYGDSQNGHHLADGIYFYRLTTDSHTLQRKMILLR